MGAARWPPGHRCRGVGTIRRCDRCWANDAAEATSPQARGWGCSDRGRRHGGVRHVRPDGCDRCGQQAVDIRRAVLCGHRPAHRAGGATTAPGVDRDHRGTNLDRSAGDDGQHRGRRVRAGGNSRNRDPDAATPAGTLSEHRAAGRRLRRARRHEALARAPGAAGGRGSADPGRHGARACRECPGTRRHTIRAAAHDAAGPADNAVATAACTDDSAPASSTGRDHQTQRLT